MSDLRSVFVDEGVLDINYIPPKLLHRNEEKRLLEHFFDYLLSAPYEMSQRAIIIGGVGTGKTALAQLFGRELIDKAKKRRVKVRYIHINCRELRGSLFMILRRVVKIMRPDFPERGYAANELMEMLMQLLAEEDTQLLLTLDEIDSLIDAEGTDALYALTRVQEGSSEESRRLSLLCITKDINILKKLDKSTISSLQRSLIQLKEYSSPQLSSILLSRAEAAFRKDAIPLDIIDFISELAAQEHGDARYAIDLLWRSGKYADIEMSRQININHVRKAVPSVFPTLKEEYINHLNLHELYVLLAISRFFKTKNLPNASTGEIELLYKVVCEEYSEKPRGHTQFWKYLNQLKGFDAVNIKMDSSSQGRTQLISLTKIPAEDLEKEVLRIIDQK